MVVWFIVNSTGVSKHEASKQFKLLHIVYKKNDSGFFFTA